MLIVAVSVVLGARLLGGADDTVAVWAARGELTEGTALAAGDLVARRIRFADETLADRYLSATDRLPPGTTLQRDVAAGELLPRSALGTSRPELVEVPLAVAAEAVPGTVHTGSVVDVWVTPASGQAAPTGGQRPVESVLIFDDVTVVAAPRSGSALGPSTTRQVIVGVGSAAASSLPESLGRLAGGSIVITQKG